jgi:hypothetical protein
VDVGREDGEQQRQQPPAREAAATARDERRAADDLGDAADDHGLAVARQRRRHHRFVAARDQEVEHPGGGEEGRQSSPRVRHRRQSRTVWQGLGFFYLLAFGGSILGCVASRCREGKRGYLTGFLIAQVYAPYTWFLWPVLVRSTVRQLRARDDWAKTEREPLEGASRDQSPNLV